MTVRLTFIAPHRKAKVVEIRIADGLTIKDDAFHSLFSIEHKLNSLPGTNTRVHISLED